MSKKTKFKTLKIVFTIILFLVFIGIVLYLFPTVSKLGSLEGQALFKEKVSGFSGLLALFGLQIAQIFLIILPGEPIEIFAGMCYGKLFGTLFIIISNLIISTGIFFLVRKFGKKFVYEFFDKEKIQKVENSKLFTNPKEMEVILFVLFLLPGTPKDLLVYVSGLLPIHPIKFVLLSNIARIPSIINSTVAGEEFAIGNWKEGVALYVIIFAIIAILVYAMNKLSFKKANKN